MSAKRFFRLVRPDTLAIAAEPEKECRHVHNLAIGELVLRLGCRCGKFCQGGEKCAGTVFRRLRPVPGGFKEIPYEP